MRSPMARPVVLAGAATALIVVYVLIGSWDPITAGHPSYGIFYSGAMALAIVSILRSVRGDSSPGSWRSIVGALSLLLVAFAAWWLAPLAADDVALAAIDDPVDGVAVTETATTIEVEPSGDSRGIHFVFYPGARVDPRAYARILSPVAQSGSAVTIVKPPLGIAFLAFGPPVPEGIWVTGGHSLGGVAASSATSGGADGLVLWASFPAGDISARSDLAVVSVYGTADAIATPTEVRGSRPDLPSGATFVPVEGAIHSYFGDYGLQPGDGDPGIERRAAQEQVVAATLDLIDLVGG